MRPVPRGLCAFLLLGLALSTQQSVWDNPTCRLEPVPVLRGQQAVMTCTMSNNFTRVIINRTDPARTEQLFNVMAPSNVSHGGWQLLVQGSMAQLLLAEAQPAHEGTYIWTLRGRQWEKRRITLQVTEPQGSDFLVTELGESSSADSLSVPEDRQQLTLSWSFMFVAFCVGALICAVKCKGSRQRLSSLCAAGLTEPENDCVQLASDPALS